jgi:peroxiredoxin family protein
MTSADARLNPAADPQRAQFERWFDERFEQKLREHQENKTPSLAIIATKGTLDMAYPPFILASTAGALGWEVSVFFTFYGLELLKKELDLALSPLGNPAMPMKMPFGPPWLRDLNWPIPNLLQANLPGYEAFATAMMHKTLADKGVASIAELREATLESGASLVACQMTVDLFGYDRDAFIPEVADWIGATTYLPMAAAADVSLFV